MTTINFSSSRYERVREVYTDWWAGKSKRPLAGIMLPVRRPRIDDPGVPLLSQATVDLHTSVDKLLDKIEYCLSQYDFYGDIFPMFNLDCFGPGVVAAFLGAGLDNSSGKVWFKPKYKYNIENTVFEYDPDNVWFKRVLEICSKASERFGGQVIFGMPDLGGVLDILSTFFPAEELLYLLYDEPEHVERLCGNISKLWLKYYDEIAKALKSDMFGYSDWSWIYSTEKSYISQSDFSYMIGESFFDRFALPTLCEVFKKLKNNIYHLDGVGEIKHLDSLLKVKELNAIQWVAGAGQPDGMAWIDIYNRIINGGKCAQLLAFPFEEAEKVIIACGNHGKFLYFNTSYPAGHETDSAFAFFKKFGVEK